MKIKLLLAFLSLTPLLLADPVLYEGFDMAGQSGSQIGSAGTGGGESSTGWMSGWVLKDGMSQYRKNDLRIPGFVSEDGLLANRGHTVVMRQLGESFSGDVYGSFRVRLNQLKENSIMSLLFSLPQKGEHMVNVKTALLGFIATRWASPLGGVSIGGNVVKVPEGEGIVSGEEVLVLWKFGNMPEAGKRSDQEIRMWILGNEQASHFAREGLTEEQLDGAEIGRASGQILQSLSVSLSNSKLTLVKGMIVSCFSYEVPDAEFDEIRISKKSLADAAGVGGPVPGLPQGKYDGRKTKDAPNILFITMDDMNFDSINSYGCPIPGISPHIDSLAEEGMRFRHAYPHTLGQLSFHNVDIDFKILPQILRDEGYITAVLNKPRDTSPTDNYDLYWDVHSIIEEVENRGAFSYATELNRFLDEVEGLPNPFYCVVNVSDPHKPFFNDQRSVDKGFDKYAPSRIYETSDVEVPAFLPEHPEIREEMRNYYNSVKRGDDCVGAILSTLEQRGFADNTVVIFVSDHGMPLPYAKSSLYPDGLRTPLIVRWPGKVEPGREDTAHLVSAVDFMPTVLEIAKVEKPAGLQGASFFPVLEGWTIAGRDQVFAEFNDNAAGLAFPMRAIHTKRYAYIFNAWGTGNHEFASASTWHRSENVMKRLAKTDPKVVERYEFLLHRTVEELYDTEKDPHALDNLIDDPVHADVADSLRNQLEQWMVETGDYVLEAFRVRDDPDKLDAFMKRVDAEALKRAETIQWKRHQNRAGGTGRNTLLYRQGLN
jgi:N-sulfoglucosamine sulfohydrolase